MIAVLKHHKNGGKVEFRSVYYPKEEWEVLKKPIFNFFDREYRIASTEPEPSWQDQLKHICSSGWVKPKGNVEGHGAVIVEYNLNNQERCVCISERGWFSFRYFINNYEYTPRPEWMER